MNGQEALAIVVGNQTPTNYPNLKGGRPSRAEIAGLQRAKARLENQLRKATAKIGKTYIALAAGEVIKTPDGDIQLRVDPPTTRHFIDKIIPDARPDLSPGEAVLIAGVGAILEDYLRRKLPNKSLEIDVSPVVSEADK